MPLIPEEQEGQLDQSEQGGTSKQQLSTNEKTFDPNNPQVEQGYSNSPALKAPNPRHQISQVKTSEQDVPGKDVHDADPTDI